MKAKTTLTPQYVTDTGGQRTAVILPLAEFEELIEDMHDLAVIAERRDERTVPHRALMARIGKHGRP